MIVDDEASARDRLRTLLEEFDVELAGEAASGVEALRRIPRQRPDVVLLDIAMPEVTGFDVVRHLPEPRPLIVFQTAHDEHAIEAFEHEALDYVLKPVTRPRLERALERARRRLSGPVPGLGPDLLARLDALALRTAPGPRRVIVRHGAGHRLVPLREVSRFFAEEGLVYAQAGATRYATDYTLNELEARTAGQFVRANRAELASVDRVDRWTSNGDGSATLTLADGTVVRVSRRRAPEVKRELEK
jgi:two-component system, LytTR family, response regulator